jgi:hypothetical protein
MREVQPEINLLVSPTRLAFDTSDAPPWVFVPQDDEGER